MIRDILSIRAGECRYCITDDTPFFFCGDPVRPESAYCPEHHVICHNGFGKDVRALEQMMVSTEQTIVRKSGGAASVEPVDVQIRGRV